MEEKLTSELNEQLLKAKPNDISQYLTENVGDMVTAEKSFTNYYTDTLKEKGIRLKDVYIRAGVSESYGGAIIRQEKMGKDRDLIIRLCIAGHFTVIETNRALKRRGMTELYAKDPRDACIMVAINNRKYELFEIDDILTEHGYKQLSKEIKE